jgi:hypothetical protein
MDVVVHRCDPARPASVAGQERLQRFPQHGLTASRHAADSHRWQGSLIPLDSQGCAGDSSRVIPHPLKIADDVHRRHDDPQVAGRGLLGGDQPRQASSISKRRAFS